MLGHRFGCREWAMRGCIEAVRLIRLLMAAEALRGFILPQFYSISGLIQPSYHSFSRVRMPAANK